MHNLVYIVYSVYCFFFFFNCQLFLSSVLFYRQINDNDLVIHNLSLICCLLLVHMVVAVCHTI